jgi:hypothetical protein
MFPLAFVMGITGHDIHTGTKRARYIVTAGHIHFESTRFEPSQVTAYHLLFYPHAGTVV